MLEIEGDNTPEDKTLLRRFNTPNNTLTLCLKVQQKMQQEVGKQKQEVELQEASARGKRQGERVCV